MNEALYRRLLELFLLEQDICNSCSISDEDIVAMEERAEILRREILSDKTLKQEIIRLNISNP